MIRIRYKIRRPLVAYFLWLIVRIHDQSRCIYNSFDSSQFNNVNHKGFNDQLEIIILACMGYVPLKNIPWSFSSIEWKARSMPINSELS